MYERRHRPARGAATWSRVEAEQAEAEQVAWLIDQIDHNAEVRDAILRLLATARATRRPRPTITPPTRQAGRGR